MTLAFPKQDYKAARKGRKKTIFTVADCDRLFSEFIRERDTMLDVMHQVGYCACCGKLFDYSLLDCGHYVSRQYWKYRWDEKNAAACCRRCNRFLEGNKGPFGRWIDRKWGAGTAELLDGTKKGGRKPRDYELKEIYEQLAEKLKAIDGEGR